MRVKMPKESIRESEESKAIRLRRLLALHAGRASQETKVFGLCSCDLCSYAFSWLQKRLRGGGL